MQHTLEIETENKGLETARPFVPPTAACALLDCSLYTLMADLESGRVPLAFDIRRPGARRKFIRIATASVKAVGSGLQASADLEKFYAENFPPAVSAYRISRLAWMFQCDYDHVHRLIGARALREAGGAVRAEIPRESILTFLTGRRLK